MKISLMPRVEDMVPEHVKSRNAIVIDMLRATSVIVTALNNGAERIIPSLTIDEAFALRMEYKGSVLGGERNGLVIEGFDAGNSPLEYTKEFIKDKTLITTTSNGTRAIRGCEGAENIFVGSMLNGRAVAKKAAEDKMDVAILCAGTLGKFSLDDFLCAGYIIDELFKLNDYKVEDISFLARYTFLKNRGNIGEFIRNATHYKYLTSIGLEDDIKYCCRMGIIDIVPLYKDGFIVIDD